MSAARVTLQPPAKDGDGAFVAYFPSGFIPDSKEEDAEECTFKVLQSKRKPEHVVLQGSTTAVDFVGKNFELRKADHFGEETVLPACQFALATFDPDAGTLQFANIAGNRVMRMDARVKAMKYAPPDYVADPNADTYEGKMKINAGLLQNFSSAKRQRTVAKMTSEKRVAPEAIEQHDALASSLAAAVKDELTKDEVAAKAGEHRNIPPHDAEATTAERAYPLERLCDDHTLNQLPWKDLVTAANKSSKRAELEAAGQFRPYVLSRLYKLAGVDKPLARTRGRALAYLQHLLEFAAGPNDLTATLLAGRFASVPPLVLNHLTLRFAEPVEGDEKVKFRRPKDKRDLLLSYIAVVALIVEGFTLETADLAQELRMDALQLNKTFEMVGCNPIRRIGSAEGGAGGIYRVQLLQQGADGSEAGQKKLGEVLPSMKMRLQAKKK